MTHPTEEAPLIGRRLTTPRAAAAAGIIFAVLMATSQILLRITLPADINDTDWLDGDRSRAAKIALQLVPFAGIAFLWFIGVMRDRVGHHEDRFFATIFLGSGLLYLAMIFVSAAVAGALIATYDNANVEPDEAYIFGRSTLFQVASVYSLRMSGVFMISLGTIWLRTGTMPKWFAVITYGCALILAVASNITGWLVLIFPAWVFAVSVFILIFNYRSKEEEAAAVATEATA